jgi:hypothetical protein
MQEYFEKIQKITENFTCINEISPRRIWLRLKNPRRKLLGF